MTAERLKTGKELEPNSPRSDMMTTFATATPPADCHWYQPIDTCWQLRRPTDEPRLDGFSKRNQILLGQVDYDADSQMYTSTAFLPDGQPFEIRARFDQVIAAADLVTFLIDARQISLD